MNKPLPDNHRSTPLSGPSDALQLALKRQREAQQAALYNQAVHGHKPSAQQQAVIPPVSVNSGTNRTDSTLDFISIDRRENEYAEAIRHSKKVRFWKIALPSIGGLVIAGIALTLIIRSMLAPGLDIDAISLDGTSLVMENPQLNGVDENKRAYSLTADRAMQDAANPTRVELSNIIAELPVDDEISANIKAGTGIYDAELKTLILQEKINVQTNSGINLDLDDAQIDIDKGTLNTSGNVRATSPQADISADSVSVAERGNIVKFSGNVRMTLRPKTLEEQETQQ